MTQEPFITEKEVATHLRVSRKTVQQWRYDNRGPRYHRFGLSVRYRYSDLDEWAREHRCETRESGTVDATAVS